MTDAELMVRAVKAMVNYHRMGLEAARDKTTAVVAAQKLNIDYERFLQDFAEMSHTTTEDVSDEMAGYYLPGEGSLWVIKKACPESQDDLDYLNGLLNKQVHGFPVSIIVNDDKSKIGVKYEGEAPLAYQVYLVWAESEQAAIEKTIEADPPFQYYGDNYGILDEIDDIVGYTLEKGPEPKKIFYVWTGGEYNLSDSFFKEYF